MATLPLANTNTYDNSSSLERISGTLKKRLNVSTISKSFSSPMVRYKPKTFNTRKGIDTTVSSEVKSVDVLKRIYRFFVSDTLSQNEFDRIEQREKDNSDENIDDIQLSYLKDIGEQTQESKKEESFFDKVLNFLQYFTYGTFIYKHWDTISKFLGLQKITETIKELSDEFGITKIIDDVKSAIDDILKEFTFPMKTEPSMTGGGPSEPSKYDELFQKIGKEQGVDPALLKSISKAESSFKSGAVSPKGAMGLMQLMPATAKRFGVTSGKEFDPEENIRGGAKYLSFLMKKYKGDMTKAVAAYNAGEGNVDKYGGIPPFKETQQYVEKVKGYYSQTPVPSPQESLPAESFPSSIKQKPDTFQSTSPTQSVFESTSQTTATRVFKKPTLGVKSETKSIQPTGNNPSQVAQNYLGLDEFHDKQQLESFIGQYFQRGFDIKKTPWCAAFANSVLTASGYQGTGNASAGSFLGLPGIVYDKLTGQGNAQSAQEGDIAVFSRAGGHHVGFVKSVDASGLTVIGGNQSDKDSGGQVSVSRRSFEDLLGIRRPGVKGVVGGYTPFENITAPPQRQEPKQKSLMEQIQDQFSSLSGIVEQTITPDAIKNLESLIDSYATNIPKKDKQVPDVPPPFMQTNMMLNVNEEKKYFNQPNNAGHDDIPPIFASQYNDFLSQISK